MVERREVDQMERLIALMNGRVTEAAPAAPGGAPDGPADGNLAAMQTILERFRSTAEAVVAEAPRDRSLREAVATEATEHGARIGEWEIRPKAESGRKLYDVGRPGEAAIATDLTIYEAALGLARALHAGQPITSGTVRALLLAEADYAHALHDAIHAKSTLRRATLAEGRRAVVEDRYGAAVRRARDSRERIRRLATP